MSAFTLLNAKSLDYISGLDQSQMISKKSLKHLPTMRDANGESLYTLTRRELEQMLTDEVKRRVIEDEWIRADDARLAVSENFLLVLNAGVKEVLIALMESGIMGYSRISRDLSSRIKAIDEEWTRVYHESGNMEDALDLLEMRFEQDVRHTTRKIKGKDETE